MTNHTASSPYRYPPPAPPPSRWWRARRWVRQRLLAVLILILLLVGLIWWFSAHQWLPPEPCRDSATLVFIPTGETAWPRHELTCHPHALLTHEVIDQNRLLLQCTCMIWKGEPKALVNEGSR